MTSGSVIGLGSMEVPGDLDRRSFSGGAALNSRLEGLKGHTRERD